MATRGRVAVAAPESILEVIKQKGELFFHFFMPENSPVLQALLVKRGEFCA
jgi:hypothetical protein